MDLARAYHLAIYSVYAFLRRDDHVEDEEMALEAIGNVVFARPWMVHGTHILQVFDNLRGCSMQNANGDTRAKAQEKSDILYRQR